MTVTHDRYTPLCVAAVDMVFLYKWVREAHCTLIYMTYDFAPQAPFPTAMMQVARSRCRCARRPLRVRGCRSSWPARPSAAPRCGRCCESDGFLCQYVRHKSNLTPPLCVCLSRLTSRSHPAHSYNRPASLSASLHLGSILSRLASLHTQTQRITRSHSHRVLRLRTPRPHAHIPSPKVTRYAPLSSPYNPLCSLISSPQTQNNPRSQKSRRQPV